MHEHRTLTERLRVKTNGFDGDIGGSVSRKPEQEMQRLDQAIEQDSEAIVRLLQSCASSRDFGVEQLRDFQKLFRHRRRLIVRLEKLRQTEKMQ